MFILFIAFSFWVYPKVRFIGVMDELNGYPKSTTLQNSLDLRRPDMPTCAELKVRDTIESYLMGKDPETGRVRMGALMDAWYQEKLRDPRNISLTEISKSVKVDAADKPAPTGPTLLDMFASFEDEPQEVLEVGEGVS